ncbi:MAG: hypothetical protein JNJ85_04730 [Candidatus Kapabacteria bacterium]|nr:hypothetical protein [Candidatus Kapabacteria bacterium]
MSKTFSIREVHEIWQKKKSIGYEVLSPNGKRVFLGYSQNGVPKYRIGNRAVAEKIASALTYNANIKNQSFELPIVCTNVRYNRTKPQRKHINSLLRQHLTEFGIKAQITHKVDGMKVRTIGKILDKTSA